MNNNLLNKFSMGGEPVKDLSRFTALCSTLGNPQNHLKFIHVAGTNGKGSVCEYISCALIKAGYKTGKFTSPYIFNVRERIQLQNKLISAKDFNESVKTVADTALQLNKTGGFSQFEILTAACFLYYKMKEAGIVVLETGIGGLLDCTNIVEPELCVITVIDYDHANILGGQLSEIAKHKAGIIKNAPCIMYPAQERDAYVEIKKQCEKTGAELIIPDTDALSNERVSVYGNTFNYKNEKFSAIMGGSHQILNSLTAIEALRKFGIDNEYIKNGLKTAQIPARLQILRRNPLTVLDGAHNRQGLSVIKKTFAAWQVKKAVVFGMQSGKDYLGALQELASFAHFIVLTDGFAENTVSCSDLYGAAVLYGFNRASIYTVSRPQRAVELASELCCGGLVLVTGSLRLAGAISGK